METIQFYFSFRSIFSWFAYHRISRLNADVAVHFEPVPVFPPRDFNMGGTFDKRPYITQDAERIASAYGLQLKWPEPYDIEWMPVHAAWIYARDQGCDTSFALAAFEARYARTEDLSDYAVLRSLAAQTGLNADAVVSAASDPALHELVTDGMRAGMKRGVFGVPFFFHGEQKFWGNDRLEWLLREVTQARGGTVPDLIADPWRPPI